MKSPLRHTLTTPLRTWLCIAACPLLGWHSITLGQSADEPIYLEEDGFVVFEIEEHSAVEGWTSKNDDNGFTGSAYLEWTGPDYFSERNAGRGVLSYRFRIQTAGNYELRIRNRINFGELNTEHNDSWVQFPTGANIAEQHPLDGWTKSYTNKADEWSWQTKTKDHAGLPIRQYFDEGDHVIEFSGRSSGHAIDRVVLFHYDEQNFIQGRASTYPVSAIVQDDSDGGETTEDGNDSGDGGADGEDGGEDSQGNEGDDNGGGEQTPLDADNVNASPLPTEGETVTGECVGETLILMPEDEALSIGNSYTIADSLRLDPVGTRLLLKFDMRAVAGARTAQWHYSVADDAGNGELAVWLASHSLWPDSPTAAPDDGVQVATASGHWLSSTRYATVLDASLLPTALFSLSVDLDASGNDMSIATRSNDDLAGSRLHLTGDAGFCTQYEQALAELESTETDEETGGEDNGDETTDEETDPGADTDGNDDSGGEDGNDEGSGGNDEGADNPDTGGDEAVGEDSDNDDRSSGDTSGDTSSSGSGAAGWPALLSLLTLLGWRRHRAGTGSRSRRSN